MKIRWKENGKTIVWDSNKHFVKYKCDGCRPIVRAFDSHFSAGLYFAGVIARREYGKRGNVHICHVNSWTKDGRFCEYDAFIGIYDSKSRTTTGRSIRFVVEREFL